MLRFQALCFAIPAAFLSSFWPIQIAMWWVLFFGGALVTTPQLAL